MKMGDGAYSIKSLILSINQSIGYLDVARCEVLRARPRVLRSGVRPTCGCVVLLGVASDKLL